MHEGKWGKNVKVDAYSHHIHETVSLGDNVTVFPNVYIGANTEVGEGSTIQYGAFIEHDCHIGSNTRIGTNAVLRRKTNIGDDSIFGSLSASEGKNWIGNHVLVHSQCHITTGIIIEDWVFIAPEFVGANDPEMLHGRRHIEKFIPKAAHIRFGSRIAVNVTLLPAVDIGREAVIGASSLVTKDVPDYSVAFGVPAKVVGKVEDKWKLPESSYQDFRNRIKEKYLVNFINELINEE